MEWIAVSLIVSIAYVYAPLLRVHAAKRLHTPLPASAIAPGADPFVPPPIALPEGVEKWCSGWADEWAQNESRDRARALYAEHGDWEKVLTLLDG